MCKVALLSLFCHPCLSVYLSLSVSKYGLKTACYLDLITNKITSLYFCGHIHICFFQSPSFLGPPFPDLCTAQSKLAWSTFNTNVYIWIAKLSPSFGGLNEAEFAWYKHVLVVREYSTPLPHIPFERRWHLMEDDLHLKMSFYGWPLALWPSTEEDLWWNIAKLNSNFNFNLIWSWAEFSITLQSSDHPSVKVETTTKVKSKLPPSSS